MKSYLNYLEPDGLLQLRLVHLSKYFALVVLSIGALAFSAWQLDIVFLKWPVPARNSMNSLTAYGAILMAISFLLLSPPTVVSQRRSTRERTATVVGHLLAVILLLIGSIQVALRIHDPLSVDQFQVIGKVLADVPGPMTLSSAVCFILTGAGLLLLNTVTKAGWMPAHFIALAIGMLGLFSVVSFLFRVQTSYGPLRYAPMAVCTAICFLLFSASLLSANPGKGIMQGFTCKCTGGNMARRMFPLVVLLPIILGYLRLSGYWKGRFSGEFLATAIVLNIIVIFFHIIWYNTYLLNKKDAQRIESESMLRASEDRYHLLVNSVKDYAIFMLDTAGYVVSWNEGAARIKGYSETEILGKHMSIFYTGEEILKEEPERNLAMARQEVRLEKEGWRVRKNGALFWANISLTALYDQQRKLLGFTKVTRDITERKSAEEEIAYMARLMEDTCDAIFSTDGSLSFIIRTWNKAAELLFGYTQAEVIGRSAIEILRAQVTDEDRQSIQQELRNGGYWKGEVLYLQKNDDILSILLSVSAVRSANREVDGFVMVCRDFTERKKLEQQLQRFSDDLEIQVKIKTAELSGILERINDAFIATDEHFCYTYLNKRAGELIRLDPAPLIGKCVWDIFPDAIGSTVYHAFNKAMADQKNSTVIAYYPPLDVWLEHHLYPSPEGLSLFIRNITEQMKSGKETTDYKYALDQSSIVSVADRSGIIKHANENFCKSSKFTQKELIGQDHRIVNSGYHSRAFMQDLRSTIADGKIWKGEICNKAKDGSLYWLDNTIIPFLNENSEPYEYLAIGADITERKKKEIELAVVTDLLERSYQNIRQHPSHLEDVREKERIGIAREIHDELGQQLTGIKMDLSWISKKLPDQQGSEVRVKVDGALDLLNATISTVRRIATELRPAVLYDLGLVGAIERQCQDFQKRFGVPSKFVSNFSEFKGPSTIAVGLFRICQESMTNIARHAEAKNVCITLHENEDRSILLKIEDDGLGFRPEDVEQKKTFGLLGMKERTIMMGGNFMIDSAPDRGTTLSVTIPSE